MKKLMLLLFLSMSTIALAGIGDGTDEEDGLDPESSDSIFGSDSDPESPDAAPIDAYIPIMISLALATGYILIGKK